jgi:hypothetical protein
MILKFVVVFSALASPCTILLVVGEITYKYKSVKMGIILECTKRILQELTNGSPFNHVVPLNPTQIFEITPV